MHLLRAIRAFLLTLVIIATLPLHAQIAGNAVSLKGTDFFRTTLWSPQLFNSKNFTFEFWFNATSPGLLVGEADTADVTKWDIAFAEIFAGGVIKAGAPNVPTLTVGTVSFGSWNHLAIVYNETNQTLSAYLNGALAGASIGNRKVPSDDGRSAVYPFGRGGPTNLGGGNWLSGKFDEVRIWRVALDASHIANYWNRVLTTDFEGLMALWHFDSTNGSLSPDSSVANNPALYVPEAIPTPLVVSTAPLIGAGPLIATKTVVVTGRSALIQGSTNPQGVATSVFFEWGVTSAYGNVTTTNVIGGGSVEVTFSETLSNLAPGTYHVRAVGISEGSRFNGSDVTFTILPPSIQTTDAIVTDRNVKLQGTANPQGVAAQVYFQWGISTAYGNSTPARDIGSGIVNVSFSEDLSGLAPGEYHYRAVLTNAIQEIFGDDQAFSILDASGKAARLFGNNYIRTTTWSHQIFDDEDFTFELWFNAASPGVLINEPDTANVALWDYAFAEIFPGGVIKAGVPGVPTFTVGTVAFDTWHHLALVYDGTAKLLSAYLDGAPAGSSAGDRNTPKEIGRTSIYCFGRGGMSNLGGGNWLNGLIDEVRIWRRPLSSQEIAGQYDKILDATDAALMGNWHFDLLLATAYLSPDSSGKENPAWHVPETTLSLTASGAPVGPDLRPAIAANLARAVAPFAVEFEGNVNAQSADTIVFFEYGRSNIFQQTKALSIGSGNVPIRFTELVSGLELGVVYQHRLIASNAFGVSRSSIGEVVATGWAGHAYRLTPNNYVRTSANQNSNFPDKSITVELWFFPTKAGVIASETALTPIYDRSIIEVLPSANVQAGFNGLVPISLGDAVFNAWNHVALRYNHATQTMDGFLNGVKGPARAGVRITPADQGSQSQFAFGRTAATKLGPGEFFGGDLDEIRVWNLARTDEDLSSARFNLLAGDEAGLVFNWRSSPSSTDPIIDSSVRNNIGTNFDAEVVVSTAPLVFNVRRLSVAEIETQFVVKGGSTYRLESSSDLNVWTPVVTNTAPSSGYVRLPQTISSQAGSTFFRVMPQ